MKRIVILDATLCRDSRQFSFREKIEIARLLSRLNVDVIELPAIQNARADVLLVRTVSPFVKNGVLSVAAGADAESIERAAEALTVAPHPRIRIELPVSPAVMEYRCHKKPAKMLAWIGEAVRMAKAKCDDVEFCALDATRAEEDFLAQAIRTAIDAGTGSICVCDDAGMLFPDDFASFGEKIAKMSGIPVSVGCDDRNGFASASAALAVKHEGVTGVRTAVGGLCAPLEQFAEMIRSRGADYGLETGIRYTELHRTVRQIAWMAEHSGKEKGKPVSLVSAESEVCLNGRDSKEDVITAVTKLGYDLSEEDYDRVYDEFLRVADKKTVGARELDAIVASSALQVPPVYRLKSYLINSGNLAPASAQITLMKEEKELSGICMGDGPVNASFLAIEQIIGRHYELDDFQIQSVTEGAEAVGVALVRLRFNGKLYSGNGVSTDIIGAGIRAYLNAVNKIVYEEGVQ